MLDMLDVMCCEDAPDSPGNSEEFVQMIQDVSCHGPPCSHDLFSLTNWSRVTQRQTAESHCV